MSEADKTKHNPGNPQMFQAQSTTNNDANPPANWLATYPRNEAAFDELLDPEGRLRPHYAKLIGALDEFSPAELDRRSEACRRLVQEQGITYNVYDDPRGMERPWQLDPIPFILAPGEWRALEAGLVHRAQLLNKILADCYGPQELNRAR